LIDLIAARLSYATVTQEATMQKTLVASAAIALLLGFGGIANAKDTTGNPGNGNQNCPIEDEGVTTNFKTPGKLFQFAREEFGLNPKDVVNDPPGEDPPDFPDTVGGVIAEFCGIPPS
jgi:hypothetical protein